MPELGSYGTVGEPLRNRRLYPEESDSERNTAFGRGMSAGVRMVCFA